MKLLILLLVSFCSIAHAETPWARDCVTWYGASIPEEKRTPENCATGRSHWDAKEYTTVMPSGNGSDSRPVAASRQTTQVITSTGSYMIIPQGNTVFILQTAK